MNSHVETKRRLKLKTKVQILVAIIGFMGAIGAALIVHMDKWWFRSENIKTPSIEITEVEVNQMIENWRIAWQRGDWQSYSQFYDSSFSGRNYSRERGYRDMNRSEWIKDKTQKYSRSSIISIQLKDKNIKCNKNDATVTFTQSYQSARYVDSGIKTLHLRKHPSGAVYILWEGFTPQ